MPHDFDLIAQSILFEMSNKDGLSTDDLRRLIALGEIGVLVHDFPGEHLLGRMLGLDKRIHQNEILRATLNNLAEEYPGVANLLANHQRVMGFLKAHVAVLDHLNFNDVDHPGSKALALYYAQKVGVYFAQIADKGYPDDDPNIPLVADLDVWVQAYREMELRPDPNYPMMVHAFEISHPGAVALLKEAYWAQLEVEISHHFQEWHFHTDDLKIDREISEHLRSAAHRVSNRVHVPISAWKEHDAEPCLETARASLAAFQAGGSLAAPHHTELFIAYYAGKIAALEALAQGTEQPTEEMSITELTHLSASYAHHLLFGDSPLPPRVSWR